MAAKPRALLTGANGFIGSALRRALLRTGWKVFSLVRRPTDEAAAKRDIGIELIHDGTTQGMLKIVRAARPDVIFHLASLFLAEHRLEDIETLCRSNILLGTQLLETASSLGACRLINTGTAWQHYRDAGYDPVNLYAATKQAFEDIVKYYVEARDVRAVTLTIFDSYGPGDRRPKIWKALHSAGNGAKRLKFSAGRQKLDPIYIDDIVAAYLIAAKRLLAGRALGHEIYALSSGHPRPLREIVGLYEKVTKRKIPASWGARPYRPREVMIPWNKGKKLPGWRPKISLAKGIALTAASSDAA